MANQIEQVLNERGKRYGDFTDHAKIAQALQQTMQGGVSGISRSNWYRLDDVQRQPLTVIADKIARILSGDPNYDDNWIDIQGYAKLAQDRLPKQGELFDVRPKAEQVHADTRAGEVLGKLEEYRRLYGPSAAGGFMFPPNCE